MAGIASQVPSSGRQGSSKCGLKGVNPERASAPTDADTQDFHWLRRIRPIHTHPRRPTKIAGVNSGIATDGRCLPDSMTMHPRC
jgi:hypothetical protein